MTYSLKPGVKLNSNLRAAAQKIADSLPFDIVVTSGIRDAREQAQAMFDKIRAAGDTYILIADYFDDSFAQGVIDAWDNGQNLNQATEFVQSYFDEGKGSKHGRGDAIDIRTTGGDSGQLDESQIAQLISAVTSLGYWPFREYSPPHLHIRVPAGEGSEKKILPLLAMVLGGLWILRR
jgi:hypothetical protein